MKNKDQKIDWLNHGLEFIIVVVGILLAFQLNSWAEKRNQNKIIEEHLESLEEESRFNYVSLNRSLTYAEQEIKNVDSLIFLVKEGSQFTKINALTFQLLRVGRVYFQKNAYNTLSSTGDIRFIEDFNLKEDLVNLYEYYNWTEAMDKINLEYYTTNYYPYVMDNLDLIGATIQPRSVYTSQKFKNILAGYRYQTFMRKDKYEDCKEEMIAFMKKRGWELESLK